jgi:hypothetical protein
MMVMAFFSCGGPLSISSVTVAHMLTSLRRKGPQDREGGMYSMLGAKDMVRRNIGVWSGVPRGVEDGYRPPTL